MIRSMTGFGSSGFVVGRSHYRMEVKAVNGKFCDVKVKVYPEYARQEPNIKQLIRDNLSRGHIEIMQFRDGTSMDSPQSVTVNWDLAESYYKAYQSVRHKFGISQDVSLSMVTGAREVITFSRGEEDSDVVWKKIKSCLETALESVIQMRETEGKALAVDMAGRCNIIKEFVSTINKQAPKVVENYKKRLEEKIASISAQEIDQTRLAQEILYFADRSDISEEVTRLRSHLQQFLHYLDVGEPVGRKLDFIIQEMNREANTIGSKCNNAQIAQLVVEVKSELEKLREQVQNVE